jgi:aspartate/methionine/tyrosine aminotransferase
MKLISRTLDLVQSPIASAHALLQQYRGRRPVLDLSQGEPNYPTATVIANHVAKIACDPDGGRYTTRPGIDKLRKLVADEISQAYSGTVRADQVLITAGCNQAFCLAISVLAEWGDEVILPVPYYFNHDMWLRLERISPIYLNTASPFIPDPDVTEALITNKTKAIVLVTPGNPTGVTIPSSVIQAFADLAKQYGIMLIIDETYRVFRPVDEPAHELFGQHCWDDNVISLHSFSKEFAIPGYRVGAAICHPDMIVEMMKLFDCMAICAPRLGQEAVIAALTEAKDWRHDRVLENRKKQVHFESIFANHPGGFELCSAGAYYGWVKHPAVGEATTQVVRRLLLEQGTLVLPGTIFTPSDDGYLRLSFASLSIDELDELGTRLREFV